MLYRRELEIATKAAKVAARELRNRFGGDYSVTYKTPIEPVTEADFIADRILHRRLMKAFPKDAWLSEEAMDDQTRLKCERVWVVDPLDGTREFIEGRHEFCVSVALVVDGEPVVGVIVNPMTGNVYTAARGLGAFCNGQPILASSTLECSEFEVVVSRNETKRGDLEGFQNRFTLRPLGGMCQKLVAVATGDADATFTCGQRCEWDMAAGLVIVLEAGGSVTLLDGSPLVFNQAPPVFTGIVASNGKDHDFLRKAVLTVNGHQ